jgi:type III secretion protein J
MPVGSAIRPIVLAVALAASGLFLGSCERRETLVTVDSQREALEILVELREANILGARADAQTRNRKDVQVVTLPAAEIAVGRALLLQLDLPRRERQGLETYVTSAGMIPTPGDERARLMHAISGELERTLEAVSGVARARVHVVLPAEDSFSPSAQQPAEKVTASVLLVVNAPGDGDRSPSAPAVDIKSLSENATKIVSSAVPGLDPSGVQVVVSERAMRPILGATEDPGTRAENLASLVKMLLIAAGTFGLLFILTLVWAMFFRGPKIREDSGELAVS